MNENTQQDTIEYPTLWLLCSNCGITIPQMRVFVNSNEVPMIDIKCTCTRIHDDSGSDNDSALSLEKNLYYMYHNRIETITLEKYLNYLENLQLQINNDNNNYKYCLNGHGFLGEDEFKVHEQMFFETKHLISNQPIDLHLCCQSKFHKDHLVNGKVYYKPQELILCKKCLRNINNNNNNVSHSNIEELKLFQKEITSTILDELNPNNIDISTSNLPEKTNQLLIQYLSLLVKSYIYISHSNITNYALAKSLLTFYRTRNHSTKHICPIINPLVQSGQYTKTFSMKISRYTYCNEQHAICPINEHIDTDRNKNETLSVNTSNNFLFVSCESLISYGTVLKSRDTGTKYMMYTSRNLLFHKISSIIQLCSNIFAGIKLSHLNTKDSSSVSLEKEVNMIYIFTLNTEIQQDKRFIDFMFPNGENLTSIKKLQKFSSKYNFDSNPIFAVCKLTKRSIILGGFHVKVYTFTENYDDISNHSTLYQCKSNEYVTLLLHWKTKKTITRGCTETNIKPTAIQTSQEPQRANKIKSIIQNTNPIHTSTTQDFNTHFVAIGLNTGVIMIYSNSKDKEFVNVAQYKVPLLTEHLNEVGGESNNGQCKSHCITCGIVIDEYNESLAIGTKSGNVYVFPKFQGDHTVVPYGHCGEVTCIVVLLNKIEFLSCGKDNKIILWDALSWNVLNMFWNYSIEIGNDENYIHSICLFPSKELGMFGFLTLDIKGYISYWANQGDLEV